MASSWPAIMCITIELQLLFGYSSSQSQKVGSIEPHGSDGICNQIVLGNIDDTKYYKDCVVVLGNVMIGTMENTTDLNFTDYKFPKLREVAGHVIVYRVSGLESVSKLFPNLARIRGKKLFFNYALVIHDLPSLLEIGLYNLLKIDRGGVVIWGGELTCFIDTIDWTAIAPQSRHVLSSPYREAHCGSTCSCGSNIKTNRCWNKRGGVVIWGGELTCFIDTIDWTAIAPQSRHVLSSPYREAHCGSTCSCGSNIKTNRCWNKRYCQRFLEGPEREVCNEQCLGCSKNFNFNCSVCRHYTHRGLCVPQCPNDTVILEMVDYCITEEECKKLNRWVWNNTCISVCPIGYIKIQNNGLTTCRSCPNCHKTCESLNIQTLETIQSAERCVYINGSLTIHIRSFPGAIKELRYYLRRIEVISDTLIIFGSLTISSFDFLPSLRRISGEKLQNDTYSLLVFDMQSLQTLFLPNVTENLKVDNGSMWFRDNPMLCMSEIDKLKNKFQEPPENSIPLGMTNGYSGGCTEVLVHLQIRVLSETSAVIMFLPRDYSVHYSILYVRLPPGVNVTVVPETCSEYEWHAVNVPVSFGHSGMYTLDSLHPASTYVLCVEIYDPTRKYLARSNIFNFSTLVGKPEPPFITELTASLPGVVVLRWVDHKYFRPHITHYELDVGLISYTNLNSGNYCTYIEQYHMDIDYTRHAVVKIPPPDYDKGCASMCGVLSSVTPGAMVEENFDICSTIKCDSEEAKPPKNVSIDNFVHTMSIDISAPRNAFQVAGLAPYRDYRFRLRACNNKMCSRSAREVVRTFPSSTADVPTIVKYEANKHGEVTVEWKPSNVTNGLVLAYYIYILPIIEELLSHLVPHSFCVLGDKKSIMVNTTIVDKYLVRVCSKTLASNNACSDWKKFSVKQSKQDNSWWWAGTMCGVLLGFYSCFAGYLWKRINMSTSDYSVPLVNITSAYRSETEPPSMMQSDFAPVYSIPLRDSFLE